MAVAAMVGSLYFSEVMKFPPCTLCWYQRICLYPLVINFGIGLLTNDSSHRRYSLPLLVMASILSIYHNLLYFGVIAKPLVPCTAEVSCSAKQLELFGFITIPLLAFVGVAVMLTLLFLEKRFENK